jgi:hypothetical protein
MNNDLRNLYAAFRQWHYEHAMKEEEEEEDKPFNLFWVIPDGLLHDNNILISIN